MLDHSVIAAASRLNDYYQDQDRAFAIAAAARRAEDVARDHIRITFDSLTWLQPATLEEFFVVSVVLGSKLWGVSVDEVDDGLLVTASRMVRNLVRGMREHLGPEQIAALPKWVLDDPVIGMRVRLDPVKANDASEA